MAMSSLGREPCLLTPGERLIASFAQARHYARAALGPRAIEGRERSAGSVSIGHIDDPVEVVSATSPVGLESGFRCAIK